MGHRPPLAQEGTDTLHSPRVLLKAPHLLAHAPHLWPHHPQLDQELRTHTHRTEPKVYLWSSFYPCYMGPGLGHSPGQTTRETGAQGFRWIRDSHTLLPTQLQEQMCTHPSLSPPHLSHLHQVIHYGSEKTWSP